MKITDLLNEYASRKVNIRNHTDIVVINPAGPELINMANNSLHGELRCLYGNGKFYFWKNEEIYHFMMAREFSLRHGNDSAFYVFSISQMKKVVMRPAYAYSSVVLEILEQPYIKKWFKPSIMSGDEVKELVVLDEPQKLEEYAAVKTTHYGDTVRIAKNPTGPELKNLLKRSPYGELRVYIDIAGDNTVYVWGSNNSYFHDTFANEFGLRFLNDGTFYLFGNNNLDNISLVTSRKNTISQQILDIPYVKKWFDTVNIKDDRLYLKGSLKLTEYASEKTVHHDEEIRIAKNPTGPEMYNLLIHSPFKELRMYFDVDYNTAYVWGAGNDYFHRIFANEFNIPFVDEHAFYLSIDYDDPEKIILVTARANTFPQTILNTSYIKKWFDVNSLKQDYIELIIPRTESKSSMRNIINAVEQQVTEYAFTKIPNRFEDVIVAHNPNTRELKVLIDKSTYNELRGLFEPKKEIFYWWDASVFTHDRMADILEIADLPGNRLTLYKHRNKDYVLSTSERVMNHPYIQKNFEKTNYDAYKLRVDNP